MISTYDIMDGLEKIRSDHYLEVCPDCDGVGCYNCEKGIFDSKDLYNYTFQYYLELALAGKPEPECRDCDHLKYRQCTIKNSFVGGQYLSYSSASMTNHCPEWCPKRKW